MFHDRLLSVDDSTGLSRPQTPDSNPKSPFPEIRARPFRGGPELPAGNRRIAIDTRSMIGGARPVRSRPATGGGGAARAEAAEPSRAARIGKAIDVERVLAGSYVVDGDKALLSWPLPRGRAGQDRPGHAAQAGGAACLRIPAIKVSAHAAPGAPAARGQAAGSAGRLTGSGHLCAAPTGISLR
jgi:hypothetical protein